MTAIGRVTTHQGIRADERDRCRREAEGGACPACGRTEQADLERQVRSYAASVAALHARLRGYEEAAR